MSVAPLFRRLRRFLGAAWDYLPGFPRLPSPRDIAVRWRNGEFRLPFPSTHDFLNWWRETRHLKFLPPLPRVPTPRRMLAQYRSWKEDPFAPKLPPVPTAQDFAEHVREQPGTLRRLLWIAGFIFAAAVVGFAALPAWRALKGWRAHQFAEEASHFIELEQWNDAAQKIHGALQLRQMDPEAWHANAQLLSRAGRGAAAVEWWSKISRTRPLSNEDRRDYATASLSANELGLAETQINALFAAQQKPTPADLLLAGQLDVLRGRNAEALGNVSRAESDAAISPREELTANLLELTAALQDSPQYVEASRRLVQMARSESNQISLEALVILAKQLAARPPGASPDRPLAIPLPQLSPQNMAAVELADRLERHPNSRPYHKMLAMEMRARADPGREGALIEQALKTYGESDDQTATALGAWLYTRGHFQAILKLLPPERAILNRDLLLERIDAQAALGRFVELKNTLSVSEYPVLPSTYQHMYLAVVRGRLGEGLAAANEWHMAFDFATTTEVLLALADYAQKNERPEIVDQALAKAIIKQPGLRSANVWRLRVLETIGPTANAHDLANDIIALWPEDIETRLHEIYLRLLLDTSVENAQIAEREAIAISAKTRAEGLARSTIGLAKLRQGHPAAALDALGGSNLETPGPNVSWPVYAAALAANGWKEKARYQAEKLAAVKLLPEERALIAPLFAEKTKS